MEDSNKKTHLTSLVLAWQMSKTTKEKKENKSKIMDAMCQYDLICLETSNYTFHTQLVKPALNPDILQECVAQYIQLHPEACLDTLLPDFIQYVIKVSQSPKTRLVIKTKSQK